MNKVLFITLFLIIAGCSNVQTQTKNNEDLDEFISALDDKSLDEIKEEMNINIKQFEAFLNFFDGSFSNSIKSIKKEDEKYGEEFKIDTTGIHNALNQFNSVVFDQYFESYESHLKFSFTNTDQRRPLELGQGISQTFSPTKIYYHSGEIKTDSVENYMVDFSFDREGWGTAKPIDSIDISYELAYIKDYDSVEVSNKNNKTNYKGGEIKLVKTDNNYAYITLSDTIASPFVVQGYNKEGKLIDRSGSSSNTIAPGDSEGIFSEMLKYLKIVQEKLNDGDFKSTADFQKYLRKHLNNIDYFNDKDGLFHREYYFYGHVDAIKLLFSKDTENEKVKFTAHNTHPFNAIDELFNMSTDDSLIFLNANGAHQIKIKNDNISLVNISGDYYEDNEYYYHLNRVNKSLDTLLVYNLVAYKNGLAGIQPEDENDAIELFFSNYKPIGPKKYDKLTEVGEILFGFRNNSYFIIDMMGNETPVPNVTRVYDGLSDNRILVSNGDLIGFIDPKGKSVIPPKYETAEPFEDGITAARFNGTYKLIDVNGKVLVDTEESYMNFLSKDDQGRRIYKFDYGSKTYNYKGDLIPKQD
ncbi:KWG Leptospira repeat protein [Cellulophaga algicola DSM 14237]|uniref:KWG Leptospira repeat protein n=1 Tax=Cellulophaga algicola (strain DSM 14237 / IC166 / ACAM 630) TaxID=688270 RepID=E6XBB0_CELAD|nr:WG repeat-containing protein [Cellulophaga algicola]ADV49974.1 KWG Leptospira repeat protein [Cellulophaga algicola DSM 14237]